ncbi:hypothetical protein PTKIN_Ptkin14bG0061000 [Pterospermum kingtungense]
MAKLVLLLATFAIVLFLANASIYRTTITVDNDTKGRQESSCQKQIRKQNNLKYCRQYMEERSSKHNDVPFKRCCKQLQKLDRQCRCPGLKQAVQMQMEKGAFGSEERQELFELVEEIMSECEVQPRRCEMQSRSWF